MKANKSLNTKREKINLGKSRYYKCRNKDKSVGIQINEKLCPSLNRHVVWFIPFRTDMSVR